MPQTIVRRDGRRTRGRGLAARTSASSGPDKTVAFLAKVATQFTTVLSLRELLQYVLRALRGGDRIRVLLGRPAGRRRYRCVYH
jgi:hypothetical protein